MKETMTDPDYIPIERRPKPSGVAEFAFAVSALINANEMRRDELQEQFRGMTPAAFVHEFCTVSVDCGRRLGKTTFIRNHAGPDDVVVAGNRLMRDEISRGSASLAVLSPPFDDALRHHLLGRPAPSGRVRIWVDEPAMLSDRDYAVVVDAVTRHAIPALPTVILLGQVRRGRDTSLPSWSEPYERRRGRASSV